MRSSIVTGVGLLAWGVASINALPWLFSRQDTQVPLECQSVCDPVLPLITNGGQNPTPALCPNSTVAGCCNVTFERAMGTCYQCLGQSIGESNYTLPQQNIDTLVNACVPLGFTMEKLTLPGQDAHRPLITAPNQTVSTTETQTSTGTTLPTTTVPPTSNTGSRTNIPTSASSTSDTQPTTGSGGSNSASGMRVEGTVMLTAFFGLMFVLVA
ncbi:hypothetical protein VNI00_004893 [Paramarasmius palmivorus]|uniref:Uncharacterized protein n=1 Tax=Paramarasmius palmivorus TaxID=297713 RepID=A0AAW0DJS1_9AGAR